MTLPLAASNWQCQRPKAQLLFHLPVIQNYHPSLLPFTNAVIFQGNHANSAHWIELITFIESLNVLLYDLQVPKVIATTAPMLPKCQLTGYSFSWPFMRRMRKRYRCWLMHLTQLLNQGINRPLIIQWSEWVISYIFEIMQVAARVFKQAKKMHKDHEEFLFDLTTHFFKRSKHSVLIKNAWCRLPKWHFINC